MLAQEQVDLSLLTDAADSLPFCGGRTKMSFFATRALEWSDGLLRQQPARVSLVSDLTIHGDWLQTRASHLQVQAESRAAPPRVLDVVLPGGGAAPAERVDILHFDGEHLVSRWKTFLTVLRRWRSPAPAAGLDATLGASALLLGRWRVRGDGWEGSISCEPILAGHWLRLDTCMRHPRLGAYDAHCLIGSGRQGAICHKYFAGGSTFFARQEGNQAGPTLTFVGPRSEPGRAPVEQRTTYRMHGANTFDVVGEIRQADGTWRVIADLQAQRA